MNDIIGATSRAETRRLEWEAVVVTCTLGPCAHPPPPPPRPTYTTMGGRVHSCRVIICTRLCISLQLKGQHNQLHYI